MTKAVLYSIQIFVWYLFVFLFPMNGLFSQNGSSDFGIRFSGFVKNDFFYDTRQTVTIREGHFLLYPAHRMPDANQKDINATSSFNFLSIQTRLTGSITAPDAFGAKINGLVEADFFGNENASFVDNNGFRLRHAVARLNWTHTELLFGQFWHPMFVPACFSEVISFNTGAPFQPFSRNPQIRITQQIHGFRLIGAMAAQRDFTSPGGSVVLRNSPLPDLHFQLQYEQKNSEKKTEFLAGAGLGYRSIQPLTFTEKGTSKYKTEETADGLLSTLFLKYKTNALTCKIQGVYGQNLFDLTMLGGYAVHKVTDTTTNRVIYTPTNTLSFWSEIIWNQEPWQLALWGGFTDQRGASKAVAYYSNKVNGTETTIRGADIKNIWRISPRAVWTGGKFSLALETEYTVAAYARKDANNNLYRNSKGRVTASENISNLRLLVSTILRF